MHKLPQIEKIFPRLSLSPTIYYHQNNEFIWDKWPDLSFALDSPIFFFRNEKQGAGPCAQDYCPWGPLTPPHHKSGACLAGSCADSTVYNVLTEIEDIISGLPKDRRLFVGIYASKHSSFGETTTEYVQTIIPIVLGNPLVDGVDVWTMFVPVHDCDKENDKGCAISRIFK